jgi:hypothetical protein
VFSSPFICSVAAGEAARTLGHTIHYHVFRCSNMSMGGLMVSNSANDSNAPVFDSRLSRNRLIFQNIFGKLIAQQHKAVWNYPGEIDRFFCFFN